MKPPLKKIAEMLTARGATLSVAESCTGGLLAGTLTQKPGASAFFRGGIVTYATETKTEFLGVPAELIEKFGVVSEECAIAMANGVAEKFHTDYALSTTGFAGPGGGTKKAPVGTVFIGIHTPTKTWATRFLGERNRECIRRGAVRNALLLLSEMIWRE